MELPEDKADLISAVKDIITACTVSQGQRSAAYRQYAQWVETGRQVGGLGLANLLYDHVDKAHSHIFSPTDLRFSVDYEAHYDDKTLAMADMASRVLTREWERRNIDTTFSGGVRESLVYGCCPIKALVSGDGTGTININARLVMPWQFGVYNEFDSELEEQEALCETVYLTKPAVWRRIAHLPNAEKLFKRIVAGSSRSEGQGTPTSFFHQVLSTAVLDTSIDSMTQNTPGGLVQLTSNPSFATLGPMVGPELFQMHELWIKDDTLNDYVTVQMIAPDILICPIYARKNLFCPGAHPYGVIRPNDTANYFWGRSELVDLMMLQQCLTTTLDDTKRIIGQQFDKLLAFGGDGINDETYAAFRSAGFVNLGPNGKVDDLTPKLPSEIFQFISMIEGFMDKVGGFSNILSGKGEQGVRAGVHADTLMRTASPRLRDKSLLVERQCAAFADSTLAVMEAKISQAYNIEGDDTPDGQFTLAQLPDDRRVSVDSHSSSPIYQEDHQQLIAFGIKAGFIGGDTAIEDLPYPRKDVLLKRLAKIAKAKAEAAKQEEQKEVQLATVKHLKAS